jgi:carboxylesterase
MGALLALHLAATHPELAAVCCYAPALRLKLRLNQILLLSILAPFVSSVRKPPSTDDNLWQGYGVQPLKATRQLLRLQRAIVPELPAVRQPILLMQGRLDPTVHPSAPQVIFDQVGSQVKQLHWLENSSHCVILDKERQLAASLTLDFLHQVVETPTRI